MSRVPWHLFQSRQQQAHLVVGTLMQADGPVGGDEVMAALSVLTRLVRTQKPAGDYATTVVRDSGLTEIYIAFEDEDDAGKLASAVKADGSGRYPGWASQWAFQLDGAMVTRLATSLPPPRTRPRGAPSEKGLPHRNRYMLPRAPNTRSDED